MLDTNSSRLLHAGQNIVLAILSLCILPLSTSLLFLSYGVQFLSRHLDFRQQRRSSPEFRPKTVLVTGVGMAKGLRIARAFYQTGHRVIGADTEPYGIPVNGRVSRALAKFYRLTNPEVSGAQYIRDHVYIVEKEAVDLWISCSAARSPMEDGQAMELIEKRTKCRCIQYDMKTTELLDDKDSFSQHLQNLGLPGPDTRKVDSRAAVHDVLNEAGGKKKYILKSIALDDLARVHLDVVPRRTLSQTYNHVSSLHISKSHPWVLQQHIRGEEYTSHSIVVGGQVQTFAACPSSELVMHYQPLPDDSALFKAMQQFTQQVASKTGTNFTGHLSFDFIVEEKLVDGAISKKMYPIECNPRAHTAVVLFSGLKGSIDMVEGYSAVLGRSAPPPNGVTNGESDLSTGDQDVGSVAFPERVYPGHYWIGNDLVTLLLLPLYRLLTLQIEVSQFLQQVSTFVNHVLFWKDATYEVWDPLPWWFLYHVYWPAQFLNCARIGTTWSRVNVSTKRILTC